MATIGYGDINPISTNEKIYMIFVSVIACGVFGYSVSQVSAILKDVT